MKLREIVIVLSLTACAPGLGRPPGVGDVALETVFLGALVVDWAQSGKYTASCREDNPVIGKCGDRVPLDLYIPLVAVTHAVIGWILPRGAWRSAWLGVTTGLEVDTVYSNKIVDRIYKR